MMLFNLIIIMVSGRAGPGWFFSQGWPIELMLVALIFGQIMIHRRNIWLFIPAGLLFGEGLLLSYYAISGRWDDWAFLWPLQVFLIMIVLWYTITRAASSAQVEELAVLWGKQLRRLALVVIGLLLILILVIG